MLAIKHAHTRLVVATLFLLTIAATTVMAQDETRRSVTTQFSKVERDRGAAGKVSEDEFDALNTRGSRQTGKRSQLQSKTGVLRSAVANENFWFFSADVVLFNDHDGDGHFHGVDLLFDADTFFLEAEVYAVVYLSLDGGPWNEYSATDNFTLFGTSADDEFNIVTELISGYPTGSYDLLIELFDGFDDTFLTSFGPVDTSELAFLPLEDSDRDILIDTTVFVEHGGGSLSWLPLLVLLALLVAQQIAARRSPES